MTAGSSVAGDSGGATPDASTSATDGSVASAACPASKITAGNSQCYLLPPLATGAVGENPDLPMT